MATIVRPALDRLDGAARWDALAATVAAWAADTPVALRDAVVLVPFAQLLVPARAAFARRGGWAPRIETTRTQAAGLGPPVPLAVGELSFDATLDALTAAALLRSQTGGVAWARRDARGFDRAVLDVVATAQALARAAAAVAPVDRAAHWAIAREAVGPVSGPGATERWLARVALEWASVAPPPATDRLFEPPGPAAWVVVQAGGASALSARLVSTATAPCLVVDTDPPDDDPFAAAARRAAPALRRCDGFEDEAQSTAAQVLAHVDAGEVPVALIAQDRVLVRRVRALLDRHDVRLLDETGWTLSTTRAAAQVMSLLHAARPEASTDALLDWLKAGPARGRGEAIAALEAACRRQPITRVAALDGASLDGSASRLWAAARETLALLATAPRQPLAAWLAVLAAALHRDGALDALRADDAGQQVLAALRLDRSPAPNGGAWAIGATQAVMTLAEFRHWVDGVLEQATFRPHAAFDGAADVIVTPLAQAVLRPFAAVVLPGADDTRLGAANAPPMLLGEAQAAALGVAGAAERRRRELLAFVHLLAAPRVTLLRRLREGVEPLADSPLVERLALALAAHGRALAPWADPRVAVEVPATPIRMTAPAAPALLPQRLSASACEALRACPYRFFALQLLRLREDDELEREIEKRDYGTWLHAVLYDFHRDRGAPQDAAAETARLLATAAASVQRQRFGDADFLPFASSFETFAPRYIAWLHDRDADGARWRAGEQPATLPLAGVDGVELHGVIDRIDEVRRDGRAAIELIDYKTGSATALREKVRQPLEDTQLAFYAALTRAGSTLPLVARYLALDGSKGLDEIEHPHVERSAAALLDGLAHDLQRLRGGAGLPALGVGATCTFCAARGVCRRDHWAAESAPAGPLDPLADDDGDGAASGPP